MALAVSTSSLSRKRPGDFPDEKSVKKVKLDELSPLQTFLPELVIYIFSNMKVPDLRAVALTCRSFKIASYSVPMWISLFRKAELQGIQMSFREDFMKTVKTNQPKSLLVWAEFFSNAKYIKPDILKSTQILCESISQCDLHTNHPQTKFDAILLKCHLQFVYKKNHCFYTDRMVDQDLTSFREASEERKIRAELYRAKFDYKCRPQMRQNNADLFQTFENIRANAQAYPADRAQAILYKAIMIYKNCIEGKNKKEAAPLFREVINNLEALPVVRNRAKKYLAHMGFRGLEKIKNEEIYSLYDDAVLDEEILSKTRGKIFFNMASLVLDKNVKSIPKSFAATHLRSALNEVDATQKTRDEAKFELARMTYFDTIDDITKREAAEMLKDLIDTSSSSQIIEKSKINLAHMRVSFETNIIDDRTAYQYYLEDRACNSSYVNKAYMRYDRVEFTDETDVEIIKKLIKIQNTTRDYEDKDCAEFYSALLWVDRNIGDIEGLETITVEKAMRIARKIGRKILKNTAYLFMAKLRLLRRTDEISDANAMEMLQTVIENKKSLVTDRSRAKLFAAIVRYEMRTEAIDDRKAVQFLEEVISTDEALLKDRAEAGHYLARMAYDQRTNVLDRIGSQRILRKRLYDALHGSDYVPFRQEIESSLTNMEKCLASL